MLARHYNTVTRKSFRAATQLYAGADARHDLPGMLPRGPLLLVVDTRFAACDVVQKLDVARRVEVAGEPKREHVELAAGVLEGARFAAVLALGGGSTIDTAKALHAKLCFGVATVRDVERPAGAPALFAMPTTAGSGSETSRYFILSDRKGAKRSHRAWSHAPDLALLDPFFLRQTPAERLVLGAFDSFVHLFETLVCRNENAPAVDMLALEGIPLIAQALEQIAAGEPLDDPRLLGLQHASAYGGLAISNVRTGLIHTLGESLSAQCTLAHPETLYVFFEVALAHYERAVADTIARLERRLAAELRTSASFAWLCALWRHLFETLGITQRIEAALRESQPNVAALLKAAARDHVLLREHPADLAPADLERIVRTRLGRLGDPERRATVRAS